MAVELRFRPPRSPVSINAANRMHWAERAAHTKAWRQAAWAAWLADGKPHAAAIDGQRVLIEVELPFEKKARRDPHNYTGTTVKAIIDGLIEAGMKSDDNPRYVRVEEPRLSVGTGIVVVRIEATGERENR